MKIGAVILAAGGSARMGRPKQLLVLEGQTLVRRAVEAARRAGCAPVVVVVGRDQPAIAAALRDVEVLLVPNEYWERGMGTSLRAGIAALPAIDAALILACDQPQVRASLLRQLIAQQAETAKPMVASAYAGTIGIPALFTADCFEELCSLGDDGGAKALLQARAQDVTSVAFPEGAIDLDTPEDYEQAQAL